MKKIKVVVATAAVALLGIVAIPQSASATITQKAKLQAWQAKITKSSLTLVSDLRAFSSDATAASTSDDDDYTAVSVDAQAIEQDIRVLRGKGAIPVASIQVNWSKALAFYDNAMGAYIDGINDVDASEVTLGTADLEKGTAYLLKARGALPGDAF